MTTVRKTYVTLLHGGRFFPEDQTREVDHRDPDQVDLTEAWNDGRMVYAFYFWTQETQTAHVDDTDEQILVNHKKVDVSGMYYPGGVIFTTEQVRAQYPDKDILASNCEANGGKLVRCKPGNWQPFNDGDQVLP